MRNEIENVKYEIVNVNEIEKFSDFLDSAKNTNPGISLSIIPNVVKDIASIALDFKKVKIENAQFEKKCQIINNCLDAKSDEVQKNFEAKIHEIESNKEIEVLKIKKNTSLTLGQINKEMELASNKIQSDENLQIYEFNLKYEYLRNEQNKALKEFYIVFNEQKRRFDKNFNLISQTMKHKQIMREDFRACINIIKQKMFNNKASQDEQEFLLKIMKMYAETFNDDFNLVKTIIGAFSEEN